MNPATGMPFLSIRVSDDTTIGLPVEPGHPYTHLVQSRSGRAIHAFKATVNTLMTPLAKWDPEKGCWVCNSKNIALMQTRLDDMYLTLGAALGAVWGVSAAEGEKRVKELGGTFMVSHADADNFQTKKAAKALEDSLNLSSASSLNTSAVAKKPAQRAARVKARHVDFEAGAPEKVFQPEPSTPLASNPQRTENG